MESRFWRPILLLAVAAVVLAACSSSSKPAPPSAKSKLSSDTIALINGDNADPYFYSVWEGARQEAHKYGIHFTEVAPPTFDYTQQQPLFADMLARHVSGIILSADATGTSYNAQLAQAKADHIPVVIVNESEADMNNAPNALSFITSANTALAAKAAQETASLLGGHGEVGIINTSVTVTSLLHRETGFVNYLKAHDPAIKVLPEDVAGDSVSVSDSDATDLIEAHPHLSAIYAVDDFNAEGAATAIKALHKTGAIKVIAIDAEPIEVTYLKQGLIQALIAQQPHYVGTLAVKYMVDALTGHTSRIVRNVEPPGIVLTPANINSPANRSVPYDPTIP